MAARWQNQLAESLKSRGARMWMRQANAQEGQFRAALKLVDENACDKIQWDNIRWCDDTRMTRRQAAATLDLIRGEWKVWSMVQQRATGACAVALKSATKWALIFEDGSVSIGDIPRFPDVWPVRLARPDFKGQDKTMPLNTMGGYTLTRYN